jgi:uncharacterized membrane protein YsdA (DUF1294 family)
MLTTENIIIYLVAINLLTFIAYFWDKQSAKRGSFRKSEASLLFLVLIGGTVGAVIAKKLFRHKTKKGTYKSKLFVIVMLQIIILAALFARFYLGIRL